MLTFVSQTLLLAAADPTAVSRIRIVGICAVVVGVAALVARWYRNR
ncbi:MAG: hypothetical protein J6M18_05190 [Actinomycetaceae bacterium]|nr:hypothetical protein [Actinomycetaceae bacterium]